MMNGIKIERIRWTPKQWRAAATAIHMMAPDKDGRVRSRVTSESVWAYTGVSRQVALVALRKLSRVGVLIGYASNGSAPAMFFPHVRKTGRSKR